MALNKPCEMGQKQSRETPVLFSLQEERGGGGGWWCREMEIYKDGLLRLHGIKKFTSVGVWTWLSQDCLLLGALQRAPPPPPAPQVCFSWA